MAWYLPNASGNFSTAGTWDTVTNTPTIHATTNITLSSATVSGAFTAPNTTNKSTGVAILNVAQSTATTLTATLQEDIGGTGSWLDTTATAVITVANVKAGWIYFRWGTPYTYATTGASRYRIKCVRNSGSPTAAADSGGLNFMYLHTDDRHSTPGSTDSVWIVGGTTSPIVTVDGTSGSIGNEGTLAANAILTNRTVTVSSMISNGGVLSWDTTANSTLTSKGNIIVDQGGEFRMGTAVSSIPVANTCQLIFNMTTTDTVGLNVTNNGILNLYGAQKSSTSLWKTTYVSGVGTAASPLVTADAVDWQVGDQIIVSPGTNSATNYNECEERFIITKNSSTSYVLSNTSGGAENAYSFTHIATSEILNLTRNALIKGISTSLNTFVACNSQSSAGNVNTSWARIENTANQTALFGLNLTTNMTCNYTVIYRPTRIGFELTGTTVTTYIGLIAVDNTSATTSTSGGGFWLTGAKRKTLIDCYAINNQGAGFSCAAVFSNTFLRCKAIANMKGLTTILGAWSFSNSGVLTLTNCEAQANRFCGMMFISGTGIAASGFLSGTKATNQTIDINITTTTFNTAVFLSSTFSSTTLVSNYLNLIDGSVIAFQTRQGTANLNKWYTPYGSASATGTGLTDTTVRTPASLALQIAPEDNTNGFEWDEYIPVDAHNTAVFQGYFGANAALAGDLTASARVELWLPGSTAADATVTIPITDITGGANWNSVSISSQYTGSSPGLATMKVFVLTVTTNAYLYVDDTFNAGNTVVSKDPVTGLDVWVNGQLSPVLQPSVASQGYIASAVWDAATSNYVATGSFGKLVNAILTVGRFLGLK